MKRFAANEARSERPKSEKPLPVYQSKVSTFPPGRLRGQSSGARLVPAGAAGDKRPTEEQPPGQTRPRKKLRSNGEFRRAFALTPSLLARQTANLDRELDLGLLSDLSEPE